MCQYFDMARIDGSAVRDARERVGLTQAELAERSGVSRQVVITVETGRHAPSVDAALRIARTLGASVEELFAGPVEQVVAVIGHVTEGDPVVAGRVGTHTVVHRLDEREAAGGAWLVPDGIIDEGLRLFPGGGARGLVVVGCDPALGVAASLVGGLGERRLVAVSGSTGAAIEALAAGRCHGVLVHGPEGALPMAPRPVRRWHLAQWQVGVVVPGPRGRVTMEAALSGRLVQRDPSAASQQGLARAAARLGMPLPDPAWVASGHLDAARSAALLGAAAVTFEPAAATFRLAFLPLETHVVELWIAEEYVAHPGVVALVDLVTSAVFQRRLAAIGGYDLTGCGSTREAV